MRNCRNGKFSRDGKDYALANERNALTEVLMQLGNM